MRRLFDDSRLRGNDNDDIIVNLAISHPREGEDRIEIIKAYEI